MNTQGKEPIPLEKRLNNFEKLVVIQQNSIKTMEEQNGKTGEFLNDIQQKIKKVNEAIDALAENNDNSGEIKTVSPESIANAVKAVLTEDPAVVEMIAKVAKTAAANAVFKQEITEHHKKVDEKKKSGRVNGLLVFVLALVLVGGIFAGWRHFSATEYTLKAGEVFFRASDTQGSTPLSIRAEHTIFIKESGGRMYFEMENEKYYIPRR